MCRSDAMASYLSDVSTVHAMDKLLLNQRTCELVEGSNHMIDSTIPAQNACPAESIPYTRQSIVTNYATQSQKYPQMPHQGTFEAYNCVINR